MTYQIDLPDPDPESGSILERYKEASESLVAEASPTYRCSSLRHVARKHAAQVRARYDDDRESALSTRARLDAHPQLQPSTPEIWPHLPRYLQTDIASPHVHRHGDPYSHTVWFADALHGTFSLFMSDPDKGWLLGQIDSPDYYALRSAVRLATLSHARGDFDCHPIAGFLPPPNTCLWLRGVFTAALSINTSTLQERAEFYANLFRESRK